ncbi:cytochrome P450 [Mycena sanguinolenta]|nr:cytochrome P450 [Mycena sanguinolenta]
MVFAWLFFTKRYDFISDTFKKTGRKIFRFRVLQHHVVALSGEEGRKVFFGEKTFDFRQGYRILGAQAPSNRDLKIKMEESNNFSKLVLNLFRKERIMNVIPDLLEDANRRMEQWDIGGKIDPFDEVYHLVFQMTIRMATCRELADNPGVIARLSKCFLLHEQALSPISFLLPWFPGRDRKIKEGATKGLFQLLYHFVDTRRKSTVKSADAFDVLIAEGYDNMEIIKHTLGVIFAGVLNTGAVAYWTLIYLGDNPKWKAKVVDEVAALMLNYNNGSDSIHSRLSAVPVEAWEDEMPNLDLVMKEVMRFNILGSALRRNLGADVVVGENTIRDGDFVTYSLADAHFDGQIYSDPLSFDPARFSEDEAHRNKVNSKASLPFLGWGAGRHPCPGMRVAKIEIKLAVAMVLAKFNYGLVDASGKYPKSLPLPNRNDIQGAKPTNPCFIKLEKKI